MNKHKQQKLEKKKAVLARNRKLQQLFEVMRIFQREEARVEELEKVKAPPKPSENIQEEQVLWSARTQEIRNRVSGQKRQAADRWNRFSGTSDAGARGR